MKVYRFRDAAAIYANGTQYLTAHGARKIAAGLVAIADSIEREEFSKSPSLAVEAEGWATGGECERATGGVTHVNFRVWPDDEGGDVIALCPSSLSDPKFEKMLGSYMHIGQHSDASAELFDDLRQAHPEESAALKREMEGLGYVLREFEYITSDENQPEQKPDDMPPYAGMPGGI